MSLKYCIVLWSSENTGKSSALLSLINLFASSINGEYLLVKFNDQIVNDNNRDSVLKELWKTIQSKIKHNRDGVDVQDDCRCVFEDRKSKVDNNRIAICTMGDDGQISSENVKYAYNNDAFLLIIPTRTKGASCDNVTNSATPIEHIIWKQISYCFIGESEEYLSFDNSRLLDLFNSNKALNEAMQIKYMQEVIMR